MHISEVEYLQVSGAVDPSPYDSETQTIFVKPNISAQSASKIANCEVNRQYPMNVYQGSHPKHITIGIVCKLRFAGHAYIKQLTLHK